MRDSITDGVILYVISILSTVLVGVLFSRGHKATARTKLFSSPEFNFTDSVRNATLTTLMISGFVTVFSVISGVFNTLPISDGLKLITLPFLELSNAAQIFSSTDLLTDNASFILTAFSISFTGVCAHMQVKSFVSSKEISLNRYYLMKLSSAILSSLIAAFIINI